jgi:hypothetical protein
MIIKGRHRAWMYATSGLALGLGAIYFAATAALPGGVRGGSAPGLAFGIAGTALIVFECLLGLRKKFPASPFGRVSTWLRAHIWLGLLSFLLILFHSGWRWGSGLAGLLMWIFLAINLSGVLGLILQHYLPERMTDQIPRETIYEQIPLVIRNLRRDADERVEFVTADLHLAGDEDPDEAFPAGGVKVHFDAAQRKSAQEKIDAEAARRKAKPQVEIEEQYRLALRLQYVEEIRPFLQPRPASSIRTPFRNADHVAAYFKHLRTLMPGTIHDLLSDLEDIVEERRELADQERMHLWLHGWLFLHVPLSMAFLLLIAVHAVMALRY